MYYQNVNRLFLKNELNVINRNLNEEHFIEGNSRGVTMVKARFQDGNTVKSPNVTREVFPSL